MSHRFEHLKTEHPEKKDEYETILTRIDNLLKNMLNNTYRYRLAVNAHDDKAKMGALSISSNLSLV